MYFGSVRFFKHLIVTAAVLVILLPYVIIIVFGVKYAEIKEQMENTQTAVSSLSEKLPADMDTMRQQLDNSITTKNASLKSDLESYLSDRLDALGKQTDASINEKTNKSDAYINENINKNDASINKRITALQQQLNSYENKLNASK